MADIKLDDLSPEELEKLMEQAKARLEEERILADARTEYKQKKKKLLDSSVESIYALAMFTDTTRRDLYKRFISMVNFLYKGLTYGFSVKGKSEEIQTKDQWQEYERIVNAVTTCLKNIMTYEEG